MRKENALRCRCICCRRELFAALLAQLGVYPLNRGREHLEARPLTLSAPRNLLVWYGT